MDSIISENLNANENENKQRTSGFPDKSEKKVSFSDSEQNTDPLEMFSDGENVSTSKLSDSEMDKTGILKKGISENDITESKDIESTNENNVVLKKLETNNQNKSLMELEVKRDKMRWLYMSELGAMFGSERHTREGFIKIFGDQVS